MRISFPYLRNGFTHAAEVGCVFINPLIGRFTQGVGGDICTYAPLDHVSKKVRRMERIFGVWLLVVDQLARCFIYAWSGIHLHNTFFLSHSFSLSQELFGEFR